jgi:transposase-like protein
MVLIFKWDFFFFFETTNNIYKEQKQNTTKAATTLKAKTDPCTRQQHQNPTHRAHQLSLNTVEQQHKNCNRRQLGKQKDPQPSRTMNTNSNQGKH